MKKTLLLAIALLFAASFAMGNAYAAEYPSVVGLKPFTSQTAYLSLIGYIQYLSKNQDGKEISREEAIQVLNSQKSGAPAEVKKVKKVRKHKAAKKAKAEEPKAEMAEPAAEAPKAEAPKVEEAPKAEEPKAEAPKVEAPKVEEAPKTEAPKAEEVKGK